MVDDRPKVYTLKPKEMYEEEYEYDIEMHTNIDKVDDMDELRKSLDLPKYVWAEKHRRGLKYTYVRSIDGMQIRFKTSTNLDYIKAYKEVADEIIDKVIRNIKKRKANERK